MTTSPEVNDPVASIRYEQSASRLVSAEDVVAALAEGRRTFERMMRAWPAVAAHELVDATSEAECKTRLATSIDRLLGEISDEFSQRVAASAAPGR